MPLTHLPYRECVGLMLINKQGRVFIGQRLGGNPEHSDAVHSWQMPQGGIDEGERPIDAAYRELFEETNVKSVSLLAESKTWYAYDLTPKVAGQVWRNRYRGQTQKWFAFRFEGDETEININAPANGAKAEFQAWRWEKMASLPSLIIPFKRQVYENVCTEFAHLSTE